MRGARSFSRWRTARARTLPGPDLAVIHIGKTAGTALRAVFDEAEAMTGHRFGTVLSHQPTISVAADSYPGSDLGIIVRDPVDRAVSGFYSRQRKGQPRYLWEWTPAEAQAFERYQTIDQLGVDLAAGAPEATRAMRAILHLHMGHARYLESHETLDRLRERIGFVGRQESFDQDLEWLVERYRLPAVVAAPRDDIAAHRNSAEVDKGLSAVARRALETYYSEDYQLIEWCIGRRSELGMPRSQSYPRSALPSD